MKKRCGISACLLGLACRYDGCALPPERRPVLSPDVEWIPFCPEQLGGLPTPRTPAELDGGDGFDLLDGRAAITDREGRDLTGAFLRGANETLLLCRCLRVEEVLLKANSPSCGVGKIYRGDELVDGYGVTAALLARHGLSLRVH